MFAQTLSRGTTVNWSAISKRTQKQLCARCANLITISIFIYLFAYTITQGQIIIITIIIFVKTSARTHTRALAPSIVVVIVYASRQFRTICARSQFKLFNFVSFHFCSLYPVVPILTLYDCAPLRLCVVRCSQFSEEDYVWRPQHEWHMKSKRDAPQLIAPNLGELSQCCHKNKNNSHKRAVFWWFGACDSDNFNGFSFHWWMMLLFVVVHTHTQKPWLPSPPTSPVRCFVSASRLDYLFTHLALALLWLLLRLISVHYWKWFCASATSGMLQYSFFSVRFVG